MKSHNDIIVDVARAWNLQRHIPSFYCPDGYVMIALLCNAAAKFIDESFYEYKPYLVEMAAVHHNNVWENEGVVYFETSVGQISFHVFLDEDFILQTAEFLPVTDELLPSANGRGWRGGWMQNECLFIVEMFLNGGEDHHLEYRYVTWLDQVQP